MSNTPGYGALYYAKNREKILQQKRDWYFKNPNAHSIYDVKAYNKNFIKHLVNAARRRAKERGLEFDLDYTKIQVPNVCPILRKPMVTRTRYAASIDRIDNTKGYTMDNIQIISRRANSMKNDATPEDLEAFAHWVRS